MAKSGDRSENRISAGDCDAVAAAVRIVIQNLFVAAVPVDMWAKAEPVGASRSSTYPRASRRVMLALLVKTVPHLLIVRLELHVPRTPQAELLLSMLARANTVNDGVCICIFCVGARQRCALHLHTRCWRATFVNCICILGVHARCEFFVNAATLGAMLTPSNDSRQHDFADLDRFFSLSDRDVRLHGGQLNEHKPGQIG